MLKLERSPLQKSKSHRKAYNFPELATAHPELEDYMFHNAYGNISIDFSNPKAVKALNTALLKHDYKVSFWEFPDKHLCPPIPSRAAYIHLLKDLITHSGLTKNIKVLDIGTGATCIYPLLGNALYAWSFIASEIDQQAIEVAQQIIDKNRLGDAIELRFQKDKQSILYGILKPKEKVSAAMCNPPFYKNEAEAIENTMRKQKGLAQKESPSKRNFSGTANELWYPGGEKAFLHNYLYQSSLSKTSCFWYTSLVSKKELINSMRTSLKKLGATKIEVRDLNVGHKISRVVAWTFLSEKEQREWMS